jgi:rhomboid protease GluP
MKLRGLIADFREVPATMLLGTAWVVIFLAMVGSQLVHGQIQTPLDLILPTHWDVSLSHQFGDMTLADLHRGEVWRALTATFVHYGLLHLGLNLLMFYQLGAEIESWYGSSKFAAIYVMIASGGNILSGVVRTVRHANPQLHYGGGSVVVLGLVALLAVVGWRSPTKFGQYVRSQMVWILIATAVLGVLAWKYIDNWGHAGGAMMGAAIGFAHRLLLRNAGRPAARALGMLAVLLLSGSAVAQVLDVRDEWREQQRREQQRREQQRREQQRLEESFTAYQAAVATRERLAEVGPFYNVAVQRLVFNQFVPKAFLRVTPRPSATVKSRIPPLFEASDDAFRRALKEQLERLDSVKDRLGTGPTAAEFSRVRKTLAHVFKQIPNDGMVRAFQADFAALMRRALREEEAARKRVEALAPRK